MFQKSFHHSCLTSRPNGKLVNTVYVKCQYTNWPITTKNPNPARRLVKHNPPLIKIRISISHMQIRYFEQKLKNQSLGANCKARQKNQTLKKAIKVHSSAIRSDKWRKVWWCPFQFQTEPRLPSSFIRQSRSTDLPNGTELQEELLFSP